MTDTGRPTKVLVSGATGFVGSHVVRAALERGCDVVALVRPGSRTPRPSELPPPARFVEADLYDPESMRRAAVAASPDVAVHLAWAIGPDCYESADNLACVGGSLALLRGLVDANCPRMVFVGTHLELEPGDADMREEQPAAPRNLYAQCKDAVRRIALAYLAGAGSSFAWARLFNIYGPGQPDWALVPYVIRHLLDGRRCHLTHGEQVRAFLHVRDVAEALLAVALSPLAGVVHVGGGEVATVRDLALRIGARLGRRELLAFGELAPTERDAPRIVPSAERLGSELGFRPRVTLDAGLADTIDWWRRAAAARTA